MYVLNVSFPRQELLLNMEPINRYVHFLHGRGCEDEMFKF